MGKNEQQIENKVTMKQNKWLIQTIILVAILVLSLGGLGVYLIVKANENKKQNDPTPADTTQIDTIYNNLLYIAEYQLNQAYEYTHTEENIKAKEICCLDYDNDSNSIKYVCISENYDLAISIYLSSSSYTTSEELLNSLDKENFSDDDLNSYNGIVRVGAEEIVYKSYNNLPRLYVDNVYRVLYYNISYMVDVDSPAYFSMTYKDVDTSIIYSIIDYEYVYSYYYAGQTVVEDEPSQYPPSTSLLYKLLDKIV